MVKLNTVGFEAGPDFPTEVYNKIHSCLNKHKDTHKTQWALFGLGWNGLVYRYRALVEYDEDFTQSIKISASPPPEERYKQGKAFFGFFVNALSVIECFFFSAYCIASILEPDEFSVSKCDDLESQPRDTKERFDAKFHDDRLTAAMQRCLHESTYWKMNDVRRVLLHRGMPPRRFYKGGERDGMTTMPKNLPAPSDQWQFDFPVDAETTKSCRQWLSQILKELIEALDEFCTLRLGC